MSRLKLISSDAMFLGGSMFGLMEPGKGKLTFQMRESRPSKRTQNALDELVKAGLVSVEPFNSHGGVTYTPLTSFKRPSQALEARRQVAAHRTYRSRPHRLGRGGTGR